ncbi:hypothetical protein [Ascidiaceihabitans sp.]|uniref:hypothetical protein n=1 Tax=Ascidiaceihabitans sp. TaxID=1872644 RepID=UPI00329A51DE
MLLSTIYRKSIFAEELLIGRTKGFLAVSYIFELIAYEKDRSKGSPQARAFFNNRAHYEILPDQYYFEKKGSSEGFLVEMYDKFAPTDEDYDAAKEAYGRGFDVRIVSSLMAGIEINFFRSAEHYSDVANEMQALLQTKQFFLADPQSGDEIHGQFPSRAFVIGMMEWTRKDMDRFLRQHPNLLVQP